MGTQSTPNAETNPPSEGFTNQCLEQLKADEGFRPHPYRDSVGKLTVGYGRNLDDDGLTISEAGFLLFNDFQFAMHCIYKFLPWSTQLDDARLGVLCNMTFNMGIQNLLTFGKMLNYCENGNYELAAQEMQNSRWARQVGDRAVRLTQQMRSGLWIVGK